jgi:hypothetical protein
VVEAFDLELADLGGRLGDQRLQCLVDDLKGADRRNPDK